MSGLEFIAPIAVYEISEMPEKIGSTRNCFVLLIPAVPPRCRRYLPLKER